MFCLTCNLQIKRNSSSNITCDSCLGLFHSRCVNLQDSDVEFMKNEKRLWKCSTCIGNLKINRVNDNCPVTPSKHLDKQTLDNICLELKEMKSSFDVHNVNIVMKLNSLQTSVDKIDNLIAENIALKKQIIMMETKIDYLEQCMQQNALEIHGIPMVETEKTEDQVIHVLQKGINVNISKVEIDHCYRKMVKSRNTESQSYPPIYCKFVRKNVKEEILKAKRKQKFNNMLAGIPMDSKIYINECLTNSKRRLFYDAKNLKIQLHFKYIWIRNGNIFMRQADGAELIKINCTNDLERIKMGIKNRV